MNNFNINNWVNEYAKECSTEEWREFNVEHFKNFINKKLSQIMPEANLIEYRDDTGDYPSISYRCSNCLEPDLYRNCHYCPNCGAKLVDVIPIPITKCKFCSYSYTGYEKDCRRDECVNVSVAKQEYKQYLELKKKYEGQNKNERSRIKSNII